MSGSDPGWRSTSTSPTPGRAISGELRLAGGAQGRTRFGTRVDLPTQSDKTYRLYAQPPAFGRDLEISLVDGDRTVATTKATFTVHDATQLVVGIVAEQPGDIVGDLDLLPNQNSVAPLTVPLTVGELPVRVEAWGVLDRLVWQDTDSAGLTTEQTRRVARLGRGRGPAGHRRRNGRTGQPVGVPGRPPALPPDGHDRRGARGARRPPWGATGRRRRTSRHSPGSSLRAARSPQPVIAPWRPNGPMAAAR